MTYNVDKEIYYAQYDSSYCKRPKFRGMTS
jgi:hypothetical protein